MKKTKRKTYNIFQNCAFMISRAWRDCKSVLVIVLGIILCGVAASLLELFVVPAILEAVGRSVNPGEQSPFFVCVSEKESYGTEDSLKISKKLRITLNS